MLTLNESLFETYEDEELDWIEVDSKSVSDSGIKQTELWCI